MFLSIDPHSGIAIYEQIVRQVKFAVAEGTLVPGQLLPSVRQLALQLAINPNTIARAFQQLQSDGVLEALRGRGLIVQHTAPQLCRQARQELVAERLRSVLAEALHAGLAPTAIKRLVGDQLQQLDGAVPTIADTLPPGS
jgi:GntR family transcriptional regulator